MGFRLQIISEATTFALLDLFHGEGRHAGKHVCDHFDVRLQVLNNAQLAECCQLGDKVWKTNPQNIHDRFNVLSAKVSFVHGREL